MEQGAFYRQLILEAGAYRAAPLRQTDIVLSESFREVCRTNQCGKYGRCWMCPPDIGEIRALMQKVRRYSGAILYQTVTPIEDSFDILGMLEAGRRHAALSRRIGARLSAQRGEFLHLSCGGCRLCDTCAKEDGSPCRFPEAALPSLEGYGVDVYRTALQTELKYINGVNTVTFFGMLLYQEESHGEFDGMEQG